MLKIWTGGATAVVLVAVSYAHAQDAVQWRVEDGGNGHWYDSVQVLPSVSWTEARDAAGEQGGHLATVTSAEEFLVVHGLAADPSTWNGRVGPWLGGYQDQGPRVIEPDGGWQWVTGEDWYEGWDPQWGEPSNGVPSLPESYLHYIGSPLGSCAQDIPNRHWNDFWEDGFGDSCTPAPKGFIIEWSADCNGDGIVDYGQILDGTYADEDGNGVPDVCQVAQWRVEDGGNGHWYLVLTSFTDWSTADEIATSLGGHLATPKSEEENTFLYDRLSNADSDSAASCWLGLKQQPDSREPEGGWVWVDGSRLDWSRWAFGEPDNQNYSGTTTGACFAEMYLGGPTWADTGDASGNSGVGHPAIEWSADCNGDGIVDYGQILDGTFADDDGNGVPDCCDDASCLAPVQWRVADGGNGHWYKASAGRATWPAAREECLQLSADLACPETSLECDFLRSIFPRDEFFMFVGLYQDLSAADYAEPAGGWRWVSGDLVDSALWQPGEPNNYFGDERYGELEGPSNPPYLNDVIPGGTLRFFIEWSADCNGDGIVDYGQILDGTYADDDGNGVPDCCDDGFACECTGDLNSDGVVGPPDIGVLLSGWGTDGSVVPGSDINEDGIVNGFDLAYILGWWGPCR